MVTPAVRRDAVAHLVEAYEMSERRACSVIGADRSSVRYRSGRPDDAALRARMRELASERRRFGYRRLHVLLRHEGLVANRKRTQRLYREEGLTVRKRRGRRACFCRLHECMPSAAPKSILSLLRYAWSPRGMSGVRTLKGGRRGPAAGPSEKTGDLSPTRFPHMAPEGALTKR